ncbi:MAG: phosphoribosylanthranilate isomerase [Deltaproteobacteria bacterium]|nr:phosphoribosylanthranilate isomerase [Deltaproteobacteria bacterium]
MEIKICGITNLKDAICVCKSGADAIGFIFYRKSPRYISPETARDIIKNLPQDLCKVGVFVNHDPRDVKDIFSLCGLTMIQLHGDESPEYCRQFATDTLIKAISSRTQKDLCGLPDFPVRAILWDASEPGYYGGTGKTSNWDLAAMVKKTHNLILAGGLNVSNINDAIMTVSPHAVDVNSGVEISPGRKDPVKIHSIIEMIRTITRNSPGQVFSKKKDSEHQA